MKVAAVADTVFQKNKTVDQNLPICYNIHIQSKKELEMGYRVINVTPEFRAQFEARDGLEGPFFYDGNRVLYYSPRDGKYINPQTDMFLSYDEYMEFSK
jgi:hypothetical protein